MASKVKKFITVSVGSEVIKLAEVDYSKKNVSVLWAESVPTPDNSYDDGEIVDIEKISKSLKQLIYRNRVNAKHIIFTVQGPKIANKEIVIPYVKKDKIQSVVDANCADYFPVNTEDYAFTYTVLENFVDEGKKQLRLMVIAAPEEIIDSYFTLADRLELKLAYIDYIGNSTLQMIKQQVDDKANIVIQINDATTVVNILRNGVLQLQRTVPYGKNVLINAVQEERQVDAEAAERLLRKEKLIQSSFGNDNITDSMHYMVANLNRIVDYYTTRNRENPLETAYIITDGIELLGLKELIKNETGLQTVMLNELKNVIGSKNYTMPENHLMDYMENLGAVLEPINFLSKNRSITVQKREGKHNNLVLVVGAVIISAILFVYPWWNYNNVKKERDSLVREIDKIKDVEETVNAYYNAYDKASDMLKFVAATYSDNDSILYMFNKLEEIMPSDISLSSFSVSNGQVALAGTGSSKLCVAKFLEELEKLENVYDIQIAGVSEMKDEEENIQESFSLTFKFLMVEEEESEDSGESQTEETESGKEAK
ncbi:MAG: pilus assembly protein PilM [Lachnospiraceae bacterium]